MEQVSRSHQGLHHQDSELYYGYGCELQELQQQLQQHEDEDDYNYDNYIIDANHTYCTTQHKNKNKKLDSLEEFIILCM